MRTLPAVVLLAASVHAGPNVLITFSTTITRSGYINGVFEELDPSPYPAVPAVGSVMTGTFSYDLAVNVDNVNNPRASQFVGSPVFASLSSGPLNTGFAAQATTPAISMVELYDDFQPNSVAYDGIYGRASQSSGGQFFGNQSTIILHWVTTGLSTMNTDAMQVLPSGVTFDLVRAVHYFERTNDGNQLLISGNLDSYTVSVSDTPEPATAVPIAAALFATALRFRKRSRILDPNETLAP